MAALDPATRAAALSDIIIAQRTVNTGVYSGTDRAAARHWERWLIFCGGMAIDPLLEAFEDKIPILQLFAVRYRSGSNATMGKPVKARTVEGAIRAIGQTIASMGTMSFGVGVDSIAGSNPSAHITLSSVNKILNSPGSKTTSERFELSRSKSNGLAIHRLNHSATMSCAETGKKLQYYN